MDMTYSMRDKKAKQMRLDSDGDLDRLQHLQDPSQRAAAVAKLEAQATALAEAGHFRRAVELFGRALRISPSEAKLHEATAQCLLELEDANDACTSATRAAELRPDWFAAHATLGRALLNAGRLEDAVNSLERAKSLGQEGGTDPELLAAVISEVEESRYLLQQHWAKHHDFVTHVSVNSDNGRSSRHIRIRQSLDCKYCNLSGEQGPGGAVWAAGVMLAKFISQKCPSCIPTSNNRIQNPIRAWHGIRVLELGSGTGIGGIAAAAMGATVLMTDREQLLPVMNMNIDLNRGEVQASGGTVGCAAFDWAAPPPIQVMKAPHWDIVIAADLVYSFTSVPLVSSTLAAILCSTGAAAGACALYAHNPRSDELDSEFRSALKGHGLKICELPLPSIAGSLGHIDVRALRRVVMWVVQPESQHETCLVDATAADA